MALKTPFPSDTKTYGFEWLRAMLEAGLQQGVLNMGGAGTDLKAVPQGGNRLVDCKLGAGLIKGSGGVSALGITQGMWMIINDADVAGAWTCAVGDATNPRIDQLCIKLDESADLGTGSDQFTFVVVAGTPTSGATLDNRSGAAALPANYFRVADQLAPAAATTLLAANCRDRRAWARGFLWRGVRTAGNVSIGTTAALVDATNLAARLECTGNPVRLTGSFDLTHSTANQAVFLGAFVDGASAEGGNNFPSYQNIANASSYQGASLAHTFIPAAGSRVIGLGGGAAAASGTILANTGQPLEVLLEELVRPNASNT